MSRMRFAEALMHGVEYDPEGETVYIDVAAWELARTEVDPSTRAGSVLMLVSTCMRKSYPAYPVRQYVVKGVG